MAHFIVIAIPRNQKLNLSQNQILFYFYNLWWTWQQPQRYCIFYHHANVSLQSSLGSCNCKGIHDMYSNCAHTCLLSSCLPVAGVQTHALLVSDNGLRVRLLRRWSSDTSGKQELSDTGEAWYTIHMWWICSSRVYAAALSQQTVHRHSGACEKDEFRCRGGMNVLYPHQNWTNGTADTFCSFLEHSDKSSVERFNLFFWNIQISLQLNDLTCNIWQFRLSDANFYLKPLAARYYY